DDPELGAEARSDSDIEPQPKPPPPPPPPPKPHETAAAWIDGCVAVSRASIHSARASSTREPLRTGSTHANAEGAQVKSSWCRRAVCVVESETTIRWSVTKLELVSTSA